VVILFGEQLIRAEILSVKTTSQTRGHRFHHPEAINLAQPSEYESGLEAANVIASFEKRRARVREQVEQAARTLKGTAVIDTDLLDEVTSMVEWPVAVVGDFEHRFLEVPQEALITTMKDNQKYFYVVDGEGKLLPHFITISNIESRDPAKVKQGNERVVRPRFEDANFFWKQDRKHPLAANLERLQTVVFQNKLGSLYDKVQRSAGLAELIAQALHANVEWAKRAALLSKCDLMSEMVGEFPGLQGIMGRYYAQHDGEPGEVPQALDELYMPRFAGDALPVTATGQVVATADRLDTLAGIFAIGEIPSGDKDPFALRRAALGALRIMIEKQLPLNLLELLQAAARNYTKTLKIDATALANTVFDFMMERLRTYYLDTGVLPDVFDAVLAQRPVLPLDFDRRVKAVSAFRALPEAASLAAANKRIANILKKIDSPPTQLDHKRLSEDAEIRLAKQLTAMTAQVDPLFAAGDYQQALTQLAGLRESVDSFFDHVMVMTDDRVLRDNRVALLGNLRNLFLRVADLSCLQH
jgi:glycyl-tRNA synthetase beta chain